MELQEVEFITRDKVMREKWKCDSVGSQRDING